MPYNKRGSNLCDITTTIDAQRMRWLMEYLNSLTDSIEYYRVNQNLSVYRYHILTCRPPINKITGITNFY